MKNTFFSLLLALVFTAGPAFAEKLQIVERSKVCMVNDTYFGRPQIPVPHQGQTYYGCCEMCKKTLSQDSQARTATDALTGKPVDKAAAVIAAKEDGSVLYFQSKANFEKYAKEKAATN